MITMKDYNLIKTAGRIGFTVSEMAGKFGKDRKTVRKYLRMDKDELLRYLEHMAERGKAFEPYRDEILEIYRLHEGQSVYTSSIHDYLVERHGELGGSDRTLRNYLAYLKASGAIGKGLGREYKPVESLPYGKQAQIDFGQEKTNIGKVHFVVVVLSRSRYRYVAAQAGPFTAENVIGHILDAFEYFDGMPKELVLDQDRTMLVAENLGDLAMTKAFTDFVAEQGFKLWVCRAGDPESKGKVENAVKFVKTNFFSSRTFASFDDLVADIRKWRERANARISQATHMMPVADFEAHEKPALRPLRISLFRSQAAPEPRDRRKVDQKSLISVSGSKYSVPSSQRLGEVEIDRRDGRILVYDAKTGSEIASHPESAIPGDVVVDNTHYRDRLVSLESLRTELVARLPGLPAWVSFVDALWSAYHRYFRAHAVRLAKLLENEPDLVILAETLALCLDRGLSSAQDLIDAYQARGGAVEKRKRRPHVEPASFQGEKQAFPEVVTRSLGEYQRILDAAHLEQRVDP
jgi:hypothetical protein